MPEESSWPVVGEGARGHRLYRKVCECFECEREFVGEARQRFCSRSHCARQWRHETTGWTPTRRKNCALCGKEFSPNSNNQIYCGTGCKRSVDVERASEHRREHRDEFNAERRQRYAEDQEYRNRIKAAVKAAYWKRPPASADRDKRQQYLSAYYKRNKANHNQKRSMRRRAQSLKGTACEICGYDIVEALVVHHVIPLEEGGTNDPENLETLCQNCHALRHAAMRGELGGTDGEEEDEGGCCSGGEAAQQG